VDQEDAARRRHDLAAGENRDAAVVFAGPKNLYQTSQDALPEASGAEAAAGIEVDCAQAACDANSAAANPRRHRRDVATIAPSGFCFQTVCSRKQAGVFDNPVRLNPLPFPSPNINPDGEKESGHRAFVPRCRQFAASCKGR